MHPFQTYHHYLVHQNFGGECVACPHTHPEIDNKIYLAGGVLLMFLLFRRR